VTLKEEPLSKEAPSFSLGVYAGVILPAAFEWLGPGRHWTSPAVRKEFGITWAAAAGMRKKRRKESAKKTGGKRKRRRSRAKGEGGRKGSARTKRLRRRNSHDYYDDDDDDDEGEEDASWGKEEEELLLAEFLSQRSQQQQQKQQQQVAASVATTRSASAAASAADTSAAVAASAAGDEMAAVVSRSLSSTAGDASSAGAATVVVKQEPGIIDPSADMSSSSYWDKVAAAAAAKDSAQFGYTNITIDWGKVAAATACAKDRPPPIVAVPNDGAETGVGGADSAVAAGTSAEAGTSADASAIAEDESLAKTNQEEPAVAQAQVEKQGGAQEPKKREDLQFSGKGKKGLEMAEDAAIKILKEGNPPTQEQVTDALLLLGKDWPEQAHASPLGQRTGFVLGLVYGDAMAMQGVKTSQVTECFPSLAKMLNAYIASSLPDKAFTYSSLQINYHSSVGKKHVDGTNLGSSYIQALGDHTGGALWTEEQGVVDVRHQWKHFMGNKPHETQPFEGDTRISLIAFTHSAFEELKEELCAPLRDLGFMAVGSVAGASGTSSLGLRPRSAEECELHLRVMMRRKRIRRTVMLGTSAMPARKRARARARARARERALTKKGRGLANWPIGLDGSGEEGGMSDDDENQTSSWLSANTRDSSKKPRPPPSPMLAAAITKVRQIVLMPDAEYSPEAARQALEGFAPEQVRGAYQYLWSSGWIVKFKNNHAKERRRNNNAAAAAAAAGARRGYRLSPRFEQMLLIKPQDGKGANLPRAPLVRPGSRKPKSKMEGNSVLQALVEEGSVQDFLLGMAEKAVADESAAGGSGGSRSRSSSCSSSSSSGGGGGDGSSADPVSARITSLLGKRKEREGTALLLPQKVPPERTMQLIALVAQGRVLTELVPPLLLPPADTRSSSASVDAADAAGAAGARAADADDTAGAATAAADDEAAAAAAGDEAAAAAVGDVDSATAAGAASTADSGGSETGATRVGIHEDCTEFHVKLEFKTSSLTPADGADDAAEAAVGANASTEGITIGPGFGMPACLIPTHFAHWDSNQAAAGVHADDGALTDEDQHMDEDVHAKLVGGGESDDAGMVELMTAARAGVLSALGEARAAASGDASPGLSFEQLIRRLVLAGESAQGLRRALRLLLQQLCTEGLVARVHGWEVFQYISTPLSLPAAAKPGDDVAMSDVVMGDDDCPVPVVTATGTASATAETEADSLGLKGLKVWLTEDKYHPQDNEDGSANPLALHGVPSSSLVKLDGSPHLVLLNSLRRAAVGLVVNAPGLNEASLREQLPLVSPLEVSILLDGLTTDKILECRRIRQAPTGFDALFGGGDEVMERCFFCSPNCTDKLMETEKPRAGSVDVLPDSLASARADAGLGALAGWLHGEI
jgi:hypothetical protein